MRFTATADTDTGTARKTNQDSMLVRHAKCALGEILMAVICDGMGGLDRGELASATVIREFVKWFDRELPHELEHPDMHAIGEKWTLLLRDLNIKISDYASKTRTAMGTTFTGVLFVQDQYVAVHVGDTRFYRIADSLEQITADQTFVAREVRRGAMTKEQARADRRRNILLQCVGATGTVEPEIICGHTERGAYMICSDGFRHENTEKEIFDVLKPVNLPDKRAMHKNAVFLMEQAKKRGERDNISVILIRAR